MLYAVLVFWLAVIVLAAGGVHALWSGMVKPRVVNILLLPGTLVAQMGHVLGLLITGGTVNDTSLIADDETAAPQQAPQPTSRLPVVGPVIVGLLPIIACALAILLAARWLGGAGVDAITAGSVSRKLPTTLPASWQLLHDQLTLMEDTLYAILRIGRGNWHAWLFVYLVVCLTVRMAPFPGNLRGALGAILVLGLVAAGVGQFVAQTNDMIDRGWSVLSLAVSMLLLLLLLTLLIRGIVALVQLLRKNA